MARRPNWTGALSKKRADRFTDPIGRSDPCAAVVASVGFSRTGWARSGSVCHRSAQCSRGAVLSLRPGRRALRRVVRPPRDGGPTARRRHRSAGRSRRAASSSGRRVGAGGPTTYGQARPRSSPPKTGPRIPMRSGRDRLAADGQGRTASRPSEDEQVCRASPAPAVEIATDRARADDDARPGQQEPEQRHRGADDDEPACDLDEAMPGQGTVSEPPGQVLRFGRAAVGASGAGASGAAEGAAWWTPFDDVTAVPMASAIACEGGR